MSHLYIGQRCRLRYVRSGSNPAWCNGAAVRICGRESVSPTGFACEWEVTLESDNTLGFVMSCQLEPLAPEGHKHAELTAEELLPFLKTREVV